MDFVEPGVVTETQSTMENWSWKEKNKLSNDIQILREKCPNTEFFLVCIFLENTDQKKLRIWTLFTQ